MTYLKVWRDHEDHTAAIAAQDWTAYQFIVLLHLILFAVITTPSDGCSRRSSELRMPA